MFKRGDVFDNPITGERATIRLGTRETMGERLVADLDLRGTGFGSALHVHPSIHERLTVVSGHVGISVDGVTTIAKLGKTIGIPAGVRHGFWNAGIYEAKLTIDMRPANRFVAYKFEAFMRNMIGLAQDGKTDAKGMPNLLQRALMATEFADAIRYSSPPWFMQATLFPVLAPIARWRGYRSSYNEYVFRSPAERLQNEASLPILKHS
jgi:mannose-6-phosphate isomerase-like protein (cupin superfamily)